jgi:WD40 repeat protein
LVQPFQATIEKSGLQLYFSALPFASSTGNISQFYHRRFRDIIPNVLHGAWRADSRNTVLSGHTSAVSCLSFSPNGRKFASGSGDRTVRLWDVATGASLGEPLTGHVDGVTCLSFSPDGRRLASGSKDSTVRLWDN